MKRLLPDLDQPHFDGHWSADGKRIAYVHDQLQGTDGKLSIHTCAADGSDDKVLVMRVIVIATMGFLGNYYFRIQRDRLARASRGDRSTLAEIRAGLAR